MLAPVMNSGDQKVPNAYCQDNDARGFALALAVKDGRVFAFHEACSPSGDSSSSSGPASCAFVFRAPDPRNRPARSRVVPTTGEKLSTKTGAISPTQTLSIFLAGRAVDDLDGRDVRSSRQHICILTPDNEEPLSRCGARMASRGMALRSTRLTTNAERLFVRRSYELFRAITQSPFRSRFAVGARLARWHTLGATYRLQAHAQFFSVRRRAGRHPLSDEAGHHGRLQLAHARRGERRATDTTSSPSAPQPLSLLRKDFIVWSDSPQEEPPRSAPRLLVPNHMGVWLGR